MAQLINNLPAMQEMKEMLVSSGREDTLVEGVAIHPVFLPGESHRERSLEGYSP